MHRSDHLHAKIIATDEHAIVGSANASASSERSSEAIVVTDSKKTRKGAKKFSLWEIENSVMEITPEKLADLKRILDESKPPHGITGFNTPEPVITGFPWPLGAVHLAARVNGDLSEEESASILTDSRRATGFTLGVVHLDRVYDASN